jgi:SAM-dependent methyltransferase
MRLSLSGAVKTAAKRLRYRNWTGFCPVCERNVRFLALGPWYRDQLLCASCHSIPRQRAIIKMIQTLYPDWRKLRIHESSPGAGGASAKLARECGHYVTSHFVGSSPIGSISADGHRNEDLGNQTFEDSSFDIVVTQDVFEHLFEPDRAIAEIARTLRPGGAHIMTVPIVRKESPSVRRASLAGTEIIHHLAPEYHQNPDDPDGSLVTIDWGYDIADYLAHHSGLPTLLFAIEDKRKGICGEYLDVVVSRKKSGSALDLEPARRDSE